MRRKRIYIYIYILSVESHAKDQKRRRANIRPCARSLICLTAWSMFPLESSRGAVTRRFFSFRFASTDICAAENASFIYMGCRGEGFLYQMHKSREKGVGKNLEARVESGARRNLRSWRFDFPQYGEQAQRATTHTCTYTHMPTEETCPKFSHEVVREVSSPSQLYRLSPLIVAALTTTRRSS